MAKGKRDPAGGYGCKEFYKGARRNPIVMIHFPDGTTSVTREMDAARNMLKRERELTVLLAEALRKEEDPYGGGQRMPQHARFFTAVRRQGLGASYPMFQADLADHPQRRFFEDPPHRNTLMKIQHDPLMTQVLRDGLEMTLGPIRRLAKWMAIDGTGFGTSRTSNHLDSKYRKKVERSYNKWIKAVAGVELATNMVTSVHMSTDSGIGSHEINFLEAVVRDTKKILQIKKLLADKAYLSDDHFALLGSLDVEPVVPMKVNSKASSFESLEGQKLFDLYTNHIELFESIYRYRSKIESVFSSIKRTIGSHVKTRVSRAEAFADAESVRVGVGRENELLAKFIAYNIRRLVVLEHLHDSEVSFRFDTVFKPIDADLFDGPSLLAAA